MIKDTNMDDGFITDSDQKALDEITSDYRLIKKYIKKILDIHNYYIKEVENKNHLLENIKKLFVSINENAEGKELTKEINKLKKTFLEKFNFPNNNEEYYLDEMREVNKKNYGDKCFVLFNKIKNNFLREHIDISISPIDFKNKIDEMEFDMISMQKYNKVYVRKTIKNQIDNIINKFKLSLGKELYKNLIVLKILVDKEFYSPSFYDEFLNKIIQVDPKTNKKQRKHIVDLAKYVTIIKNKRDLLREELENPKKTFQRLAKNDESVKVLK